MYKIVTTVNLLWVQVLGISGWMMISLCVPLLYILVVVDDVVDDDDDYVVRIMGSPVSSIVVMRDGFQNST